MGGGSFIVVKLLAMEENHPPSSSLKSPGTACLSCFGLRECICVFFSSLRLLRWRLAPTGAPFVPDSAASIESHQFSSVNKRARSQRNAQAKMAGRGVEPGARSEWMGASLLSNITHPAFTLLLPLFYCFVKKRAFCSMFRPGHFTQLATGSDHHFFFRWRQTTVCVIAAAK